MTAGMTAGMAAGMTAAYARHVSAVGCASVHAAPQLSVTPAGMPVATALMPAGMSAAARAPEARKSDPGVDVVDRAVELQDRRHVPTAAGPVPSTTPCRVGYRDYYDGASDTTRCVR